jgi:hypothetical protein
VGVLAFHGLLAFARFSSISLGLTAEIDDLETQTFGNFTRMLDLSTQMLDLRCGIKLDIHAVNRSKARRNRAFARKNRTKSRGNRAFACGNRAESR